jgi:hypothetical protein
MPSARLLSELQGRSGPRVAGLLQQMDDQTLPPVPRKWPPWQSGNAQPENISMRDLNSTR